MRYYVEINDDIVSMMECETCHYNLTGEQVADLREMLEALGYDWNECAYVYTQRAA